jgi:serine protease Do
MNKIAIFCLLASILATSAFIAADSGLAYAQSTLTSQEQSLSQGMIADLAKPAVVQVGAQYTAIVTAPDWGRNAELLDQDLESLADQGYFDLDDEDVVSEWRENLFLSDPSRYIIPVEASRSTQAEYAAIGSGFIVTPNGYIVTNAHVVSPPQQELQNTLAESAIQNFILEDLQIVFPDFNLEKGFFTEQEQALAVAVQDFYNNNIGMISIGSIQPFHYALSRFTVPGVVVSERGIPAEVISSATGQPIPGKDVAVVKIEASNLPTVPLGNESTLQSLDDIIVIGFPGAISATGLIPQQGQEPSVTTGEFSGHQTTIGGWRAIQVQTPIAHGNSGGPALDSSGRVIGIATFGSIDPTTGETAQAFNFLVPVSIVKDFLNRANIVPSEGTFTQMYRQALIHYSAGRYNEAIDTLQQINLISPNNPYVTEYLQKSQTNLGSTTAAGNASLPTQEGTAAGSTGSISGIR